LVVDEYFDGGFWGCVRGGVGVGWVGWVWEGGVVIGRMGGGGRVRGVEERVGVQERRVDGVRV
jgi:hypothetical protein